MITATLGSVDAPPTPGWRTSEFWLKVAAMALSALFASGALTNNTALAIAGMAATMLGALGYTVSRSFLKAAGALALVGLLAAPQVACGPARVKGGAAAGAFIDCEAPNVVALLPDAIALARSAVLRWVSGSGAVDASGLKAAAAPLKTDLGKCAFDAAVAALAQPAPQALTGAPASSALAIDGSALRSTWAAQRAALGWAPSS